MTNISFFRGDSYPVGFTLKNKSTGLPLDLTGCELVLTVSAEENPETDESEVFTLEGDLDAEPSTGRVFFTPTTEQTAVSPGRYFFDIQMIDASDNIRTLTKGVFMITQDISKG